MKCQIPQISWHGRDPILSVDFQVSPNDSVQRLATGGTDTHVFIWYVESAPNKPIHLEFASDLNHHNRSVNIVRFSPNGEILATGDDESAILLWKLSEREVFEMPNEEECANKEYWCQFRSLKGHIDDICDMSWSSDSCYLLTGSIDNSSSVWDVAKGRRVGHFLEYSGFVQGVAYDPCGQYMASISSDRTLRIHNLQTKKPVYKVQKAIVSPEKNSGKPTRLFYDDTLKSFCRRLTFSPDGELLFVPSGIIDLEEGKVQNTTFVFTRNSLNKPVLHLPTGSKYTVAVRCSPVLYKLRKQKGTENFDATGEQTQTKSLFSLPYRIVFAVAAQDSIFFYDTQQTMPFAYVSNIHYTRLSDIAWSPDGLILIASSTDGYCSFIIFNKGEIGESYEKPVTDSPASEETPDNVNRSCSPSPVCGTDDIPSASLPEPATDSKEKSSEDNKSPESSSSKSASKLTPGVKKRSIINFLVSSGTKKNASKGQNVKDSVEDMDVDQQTASSNANPVQTDIPIITIEDVGDGVKMDCEVDNRPISESCSVLGENAQKDESAGEVCESTLSTDQEMKDDEIVDTSDKNISVVTHSSSSVADCVEKEPNSQASISVQKNKSADEVCESALNVDQEMKDGEIFDISDKNLSVVTHSSSSVGDCVENEPKSQACFVSRDQDNSENPGLDGDKSAIDEVSKISKDVITESSKQSEQVLSNEKAKTSVGSEKKPGRRIQFITLSVPDKS